jgi:hypothetical protein
VKRLAVGFGINGDRFNVHIAAGADDSTGDFTPVGNQDFFKHKILVVRGEP